MYWPWAAAVILAAVGCGQRSHPEPGGGESALADKPADPHADGQPIKLDLDIDVHGLSGLAVDGRRLWAVAERGRSLVAMDGQGRPTVWPIADLPTGYDLESVARIGPGQLAIGTETSAELWRSEEGQSRAKILRLEVAESAKVIDSIDLPFSLWPVSPAENQGVEGLCAAHSHLVAGLETTIDRNGKRHAPLAIYDGRSWKPFLLQLTSERGKLSSLDCRQRGDAIEVLAVERHFGVMRILTFTTAVSPTAVAVPKVLADLTEFTADGNINIEGIAWFQGRLAMVVDNQYKTISGPSQLIFASPHPKQ